MKSAVIKTGAYIFLILGCVFSTALVLASIAILVAFPEAPMQKKAMIAGIIILAAVILALASIAAFEAMLELTEVEEKVEELMDEEAKPKTEQS